MSDNVTWPTEWHTDAAKEPLRSDDLPPVHPAAYHGILGDTVRVIAPRTEADPVAILVSLMAAVGAAIGDGPHITIGGTRHPARLWPLVIGGTGHGRKGTSWAMAKHVLTRVDRYFLDERVVSGLTSGEGIIAHLADPPYTEEDEKAGKPPPEIGDRRLLAVEPEFARVLSVSRRDGSVLSHVLRQAWETGTWQVLTKHHPVKTHGSHLTIIGHVTARELRAKLADSEMAGGFFNRFMPILSARTQYLPKEPEIPDLTWQQHEIKRLCTAARRNGGVLTRTPRAEQAWQQLYIALEQAVPTHGTLAEITARGSAYTMRIALLFALLDDADVIDLEHLRAAAALWQYVINSAATIFGRGGDPDLEKVRTALKAQPEGLTRDDLRRLFSGHRDADQLSDITKRLVDVGDARMHREDTGGRPAVRLVHVERVVEDPLTRIIQEMS